MKNQWFVIHTLSGQEQKVKESIEKRIKSEEMGEFISEVLVPMEKVVEVRNQKKTVTNRKLQRGDILSLNCFPMISGYYTALERTMFARCSVTSSAMLR